MSSPTRRILEVPRKRPGVTGLLLLAVLVSVVVYFLAPGYRPVVKTALALLAVALLAAATGGLMRAAHRFLHDMLPDFWRRVMNGAGAALAASFYCGLGILLAVAWLAESMELFLGLATFTVVLVLAAFRAGYQHQ